MIYIKIHNTDNGDIVAMCDSSLIDKVLAEGEVEINIKDYSEFYKGELVEAGKVPKMINLGHLFSANIVGKESVDAAIKCSIIDKNNVLKVNKIPYANAFRLKY
ncbi:MAG: DUF424 family protein [Candidatus Micrarchaeaceae archaeon]|jgi:uncharacterized protein